MRAPKHSVTVGASPTQPSRRGGRALLAAPVGLAPSLLLGNLFAGHTIQTDRPLRVGAFCGIGNPLGCVSRIGLRSQEPQTLGSRVRVPNAIADEATPVSDSRRSPVTGAAPMQSLDERLALVRPLTPEQVADLLQRVRDQVPGMDRLHEPLVSLEQSQAGQLRRLPARIADFAAEGITISDPTAVEIRRAL